MAKVLVSDQYLEDIADAIRELRSTTATYTPAQMAAAIQGVEFVTYYTGTSAPSNSQGNNGDLYFQTAQ